MILAPGCTFWRSLLFTGACALGASACHQGDFSNSAASLISVKTNSCPSAPTGTPWVPNVPGASASNHGAGVSLTTQIINTSGSVIGFADPAAGKEISVSVDMTSDLGTNGSLSLQAQVTSAPGGLQGGAYPLLVYLSDGTNEYVNLARNGATGACDTGGYFDTSGNAATACGVTWPSAFTDRAHWEQHQIASFGYTSVNTFPTCNWAGVGSAPPTTAPLCAFNSVPYFVAGKLRSGVTYTAKYVLLASNYSSLTTPVTASLKVTAVKKTDARAGPGSASRAVDLNVFLVGTTNVAASRTAKGRQNLNALLTAVQAIHGATGPGPGLSLGTIQAFEWPCEQGGDAYATLNVNDLGTLFAAGSALAPAASEKKALNIFLVSTITGSTPGLTILGLSGAIGGPLTNGSGSSGLAFASFNKLDTYNPNCTASACPITGQEYAFVDMGATIAHEMGHYFGLNHPSERDGLSHDVVYDTPICTTISGVSGYLSINSCRANDTNVFAPTGQTCNTACPSYNASTGQFCPAAQECQFNDLMWWSAKNFLEGTTNGDGNLLSTQSSQIVDYNPFVQ